MKEQKKSIAYNFAILQIEKSEMVKEKFGDILGIELYKKQMIGFVGNKDYRGKYIFTIRGQIESGKVEIEVILLESGGWGVELLNILE